MVEPLSLHSKVIRKLLRKLLNVMAMAYLLELADVREFS